MNAKDIVLSAHFKGRIHTLDLVESIAEHYEGLAGPDAIRRACKLVRDSLKGIKQ